MEIATTTRFAEAARSLARAARVVGASCPSFRSPPRRTGVDRTIKRWDGGATVAVRLKGRAWPAVLADMVEGVVVANRLAGPAADELRTALWDAVADPPAPPARRPNPLVA
jgi:hypothetical protein